MPVQFSLGNATISILNVGDIMLNLADDLVIPDNERDPAVLERILPAAFPTQCFHISFAGASILVDACDYVRSFPPSSPYFMADYQPPADLITQLSELGIQAKEITHLLITHAHFDHFSGTTALQDGKFVPCFPQARHMLNRADWDEPYIQQELQNPQSATALTLGILQQQGLLELVEGEFEVLSGLTLIPTPGESAGHQVVRVQSQERTFYCLGDLFHDPVEAEHPNWAFPWGDVEQNVKSRRAIAQAAVAEQALLTAAHISGIGQIEQTPTGLHWKTV
ncbi:MAG TPA: MBL fold metallo-hydrolase [Dictyobacter sp.]|nr:MBL fold metallo-hydrolase [Dictyobacter sp.]